MSPLPSSCSRDFFFDGAALSPGSGGGGKAAAASFPCGGFDLTEMKATIGVEEGEEVGDGAGGVQEGGVRSNITIALKSRLTKGRLFERGTLCGD